MSKESDAFEKHVLSQKLHLSSDEKKRLLQLLREMRCTSKQELMQFLTRTLSPRELEHVPERERKYREEQYGPLLRAVHQDVPEN